MTFRTSARLVFAIVLQVGTCGAGAQTGLPLLEDVENTDCPEVLAEENASLTRTRQVNVDNDVLALLLPSADGSLLPIPIEFNFFDDVKVNAVFTHVEPRWPREFQGLPVSPIGYVWHGEIVDESADNLTMVTGPNGCLVQLAIGDHWYQLQRCGEDHIVREFTWEEIGLDCLSISDDSVDSEAMQSQSFSPESAGCDDGSIIDIIVVYSPDARYWEALLANGNTNDPSYIEAKIDDAIADANEAYKNSEVNTALRLLYKGEVDYVETPASDLSIRLHALEDYDGQVDEVHALRNALHADLICLIVHSGGTDAGVANIMGTESITFEAEAFSVCKRGFLTPFARILAHETGHNMGCAHDRLYENCLNDCDCDKGAFLYSFGHIFTGQDNVDYITIMSDQSGRRIQHYSNPNVLFSGTPTGIAPPSCDSADNAGTINETCNTVASFRKSSSQANTTIRKSITSAGIEAAAGASSSPVISDDGRFIAFSSAATNLFSGDNNSVPDVFIYDNVLNTLELKSGKVGGPANGASVQPVLSGDGRSIAFASDAKNLIVPIETTTFTDVYVRTDVASTQRLSVLTSNPATGGNNHSTNPSVSKTGRFVAFESLADNLDEQFSDLNLVRDVFIRDRDKDADFSFDEAGSSNSETVRIRGQNNADPNGSSINAALSADGVWIAFESDATNFLPAGQDTNTKRDIFIRNRTTGQTIRASVGPSNLQSDGHSYNASISHDGRLVAFQSDATNLLGIGNDTNGRTDIFIYDRVAGTTICASRATGASGSVGNGHSYDAYLAPSGKYIAFTSEATNFESPNNSVADVFVRALSDHTTTRMSVDSSGVEGNMPSGKPALNGFGQFVVFQSDATNLVSGDTNGFSDVYLRVQQNVGELSGDYFIDSLDQDILMQNWSEDRPCCAADLDADGDVDTDDLILQINNWWSE